MPRTPKKPSPSMVPNQTEADGYPVGSKTPADLAQFSRLVPPLVRDALVSGDELPVIADRHGLSHNIAADFLRLAASSLIETASYSVPETAPKPSL